MVSERHNYYGFPEPIDSIFSTPLVTLTRAQFMPQFLSDLRSHVQVDAAFAWDLKGESWSCSRNRPPLDTTITIAKHVRISFVHCCGPHSCLFGREDLALYACVSALV